jgi:hypothetical protein
MHELTLGLYFKVTWVTFACQNSFENSKSVFCCRYILYDVNPPEGFNLRRDVYMRMAIFVKKLKEFEDCHLVR